MKLTRWYSGDQKPVRVGVYKRKYSNRTTYYCYWDGKAFSNAMYTLDMAKAFAVGFSASVYQNLPWRGVAE